MENMQADCNCDIKLKRRKQRKNDGSTIIGKAKESPILYFGLNVFSTLSSRSLLIVCVYNVGIILRL